MAIAVVGCGNSNGGTPDAFLHVDAVIPSSCPAPANPLPPGMYKVYVNTEGVTLAKGDCDDSRTNCTSLVKDAQTVVPPFMPGDPNRDSVIAQNIAIAQQILAPYSIDLVTVRPTSGDYEMLVLGGTAATVTGGFGGNVAPQDCATANRDHIALEFDFGGTGALAIYAYRFLSDIGSMVGLGAAAQHDDCMCRADALCAPATGDTCSFGVVLASSQANCGRSGIVDEPALLKGSLGCR